MQKKIIALAVAGLMSGAAFAQSNVTVYGIVDVNYNNVKADGSDAVTSIDGGGLSGSRIGFKGTEDLGGGMKAVFTLEYAIANDGNTGVGAAQAGWSSTLARQQYVGLTGGFGTVVAGRLHSTAYDWAAMVNPLAGTAFDATGKVGGRSALIAGSAGRASNAVAYISPSFGGFTFAYNHARATENDAGGDDAYANMVSATYMNGPIAAGVVYSKQTGKTGNTVLADNVTELGIGGSYDFGVAKAFASYQTLKDKNVANDTDSKWQLGVSIPVGNGKFIGTYGKASIDTAYAAGAPAVSYDNGKGFGLVYDYNLSKRTDVYVGYAKISNDGVGTTGIKGYLPTAGDDARVYAAGVRHSF